MADIEFSCPHCKQSLAVEETAAGMTVACPQCGKDVTVPSPSRQPEVKKTPFRLGTSPNQRVAGISETKCPSCGKPVVEDAVICVNCGLNLKTGTKMKAAIEEATDRIPHDVESKIPARKGGFNKTLITGVVVTLIIGGLVILARTGRKSGAGTVTSEANIQPAAASPAPASQAAAATPVAAQPDPVALLKKHLERLQKSCASGESVHCEVNGKSWDKTGLPLRDLRFDVKRTTSLVSPFLGQVFFDELDGKRFSRIEITLAFQDGNWVLSGLRRRSWNPIIGDWNDSVDTGELGKKWDQELKEDAICEFRQRLGVR